MLLHALARIPLEPEGAHGAAEIRLRSRRTARAADAARRILERNGTSGRLRRRPDGRRLHARAGVAVHACG